MEYNDKQLAIINAAEKLFAISGFDGTSVRDIAQEAGVNLAMISYYFGSKEKLMEAVFEHRTNKIRIKVENLLQNDSMTALEKVNILIDDYVDKFITQQEFHKIMMREQLVEKNTPIVLFIYELKKRNLASIKKLIQEGQKAGEFKKNIDIVLMMATLVGTVSNMITSQRFYKEMNNMVHMDEIEFQKHLRKKLSKLTALSVAVFIAATVQASAQKSRNLTLDEAIQLSLANSGQLKIANAKVDEAIAVAHEAWNNHLPDAKVSGSYLRLNSPDVDLKVKLGSGSPTGGNSVKVEQAAYAMMNASVPVFSGLRIKYGVESAKYLEQAAKLDAEHNKEEITINTINAYNNLYKAAKSVELVKENLAREQQRVTDFSNLEKNGLMARNDLLKAQLQQSNIELSLLDAENNLKITNINMDLMLGLPEETQLIPDTSSFRNLADAGSVLQWEQTALQNRKDITALTFREKAAVTAVKSVKGEYYPGLAVTGGYIAADVPNLLTLTNALNIGIGLQYNIGSIWKTAAKIDQANARLHQLQASEGIIHDQVRLEIIQAYQNYLLAERKINVYAKAIEQANENYRITKNKFDNNLVNTTDLLDADVAQLQARLNYTFSKADAAVAYKKLQQTAGVLSK